MTKKFEVIVEYSSTWGIQYMGTYEAETAQDALEMWRLQFPQFWNSSLDLANRTLDGYPLHVNEVQDDQSSRIRLI